MSDYSIQFVSKVTGINSHTIRAWEKRYKAVVPDRNDTGRRLFSKEQVERLRKLHDLVKMGSNISDIAKLGDKELSDLHATYYDQSSGSNQSSTNNSARESIDLNSMLQNLILALNLFKLDVISHELEKAKNALDVRGFALSVLSPLLQEVGARCQNGKLTVAQEHALSAIIKFHVGNLLCDCCHHFQQSDTKIILTAPEGEMHEFGILIGSLLCKHYNLPFYYLGPNMPADALIQCINQIEVDIAIIGVSQNMVNRNPTMINNYIMEVNEKSGPHAKIWVGGFGNLSQGARSERVEIVPTLQMLDHELSKLAK